MAGDGAVYPKVSYVEIVHEDGSRQTVHGQALVVAPQSPFASRDQLALEQVLNAIAYITPDEAARVIVWVGDVVAKRQQSEVPR